MDATPVLLIMSLNVLRPGTKPEVTVPEVVFVNVNGPSASPEVNDITPAPFVPEFVALPIVDPFS